jgi:hypothetical protein
MKTEYTIYDRYTKDDAFTGTLAECEAWIKRMAKLYPKAKGRWSDPI